MKISSIGISVLYLLSLDSLAYIQDGKRNWENFIFPKISSNRDGIDVLKDNGNGNNNVYSEQEKSCPGGRVRKEIRRMTPEEWLAFTTAINVIKQTGDYEKMAAVHRGEKRINEAHFGPNFLGWHRVYLLCMESLLRRVDPCITIPYWDSTLDDAMENPTSSVLWTDMFFGNGFDNVTSGPFKNWVTGQGQNLTRFLGDGRLAKKDQINFILSQKSHSIITVFGDKPTSIEFAHNLVHSWVGGQMGCFPSAAEDPIFWTVHAFFDCWWQKFREILFQKYGIEAVNDYPMNVSKLHNAKHPMHPFTSIEPFLGFSNLDGYINDLKIYRCEEFPSCSKLKPDCESPYLYCDTNREVCVSIEGNHRNEVSKNNFKSKKTINYAGVKEACKWKNGTLQLSVFKTIDFPLKHLPKLEKMKT